MALLIRAPTGWWNTWWGSRRSRPSLYRENPRLGRVGCSERVRDTERKWGDGERDCQQQLTDIMADHGVSFLDRNRYEENAHARASIPRMKGVRGRGAHARIAPSVRLVFLKARIAVDDIRRNGILYAVQVSDAVSNQPGR